MGKKSSHEDSSSTFHYVHIKGCNKVNLLSDTDTQVISSNARSSFLFTALHICSGMTTKHFCHHLVFSSHTQTGLWNWPP